MSIPEGIHPQSFRSTFGHNTNIWAFKKSERVAKKPNGVAVSRPLTVQPRLNSMPTQL